MEQKVNKEFCVTPSKHLSCSEDNFQKNHNSYINTK